MRNKSILEKPVGGTAADVADAIAKKHTQNTDTALGTVGTKNPPIDADLALYRDSTAANVLVTSTWTQIKAFLKTYFDTLYNLYVHPNHSGEVTSVADGATTIAANAVTNAKAAQMATKTYKGRTTAATGNAEDVPVATVKTDLVLVKADVGLGNVENTVHSTDAHTMTLDGRDVSVDGTKLDGIEAEDFIVKRNKQETDVNYTLGPSYNGLVVGPWTIANTKTFTITDGCIFQIL